MGKLGQILVARGWITVQQLTRALKNQNVVGGRLGTCLLEMEALTEDQLAKGLSEQLGVPAAVVDELRGVPEEVLELLPAKLARRCRAVPFRALGGRLDVAMLEARNLAGQDEIAFATGRRVKVHVALEIRIYEALEKYYDEECPSRFAHLLDRLNRARYMWEQERPERSIELPVEHLPPLDAGPFAPQPRLVPPPLPEPALPPSPRRERAARPFSTPLPVAPLAPATPLAKPSAAPLLRAVDSTAAEPQPRLADLPLRRPAPLRSVPLTPEERSALASEQATAPASAAPPAPPSAVATPPEAAPEIAARAPVGAAAAARAPQSQDAPAKSAPAPAAPATVEEVDAAFGGAADLEAVARLLLAFLARRYRRAALFQVARDRAIGWHAVGEGIDAAAFERFRVGFDQPSIFLNLRQGSGIHMGSLPPMPAHRELAQAWGGELPRDCVMLPVRLKNRLVTVIYADRAESGAPGLSLDELRRLAASTARAYERSILRKKQLSTGL